MATIGLNLDGEVEFGEHMPDNPNILDFRVVSYCGEGRYVYEKDHVNLHGTPAQLRAFFLAGLGALPADAAAKLVYEPDDRDSEWLNEPESRTPSRE